jgi:hypothetical protein
MFLQFLRIVSSACIILTERALIEAGSYNKVSATAEVACADRLSVTYQHLVEFILDVPPSSCRLTAPKTLDIRGFCFSNVQSIGPDTVTAGAPYIEF